MRQRNQNRNIIIKTLKSSKKWKNQFNFINIPQNIKPSWMGFPILLSKKFRNKKNKFINYLDSKGIETRPIISGNFLNHPAAKLYKLNKDRRKFQNTQDVQELGFLIGLHTKKINKNKLKLIQDSFFKIDSI